MEYFLFFCSINTNISQEVASKIPNTNILKKLLQKFPVLLTIHSEYIEISSGEYHYALLL